MATDAWSSSGGLIQGIVPHTQGGSWYNPLNYDFGFSELTQGAGNAVGNFLFGSPVYAATPEGGSNLFGGNQAQAPAPSPTQTTQTSPTNTQTTGTGGTGTGGIGTLPGTNTNTNTGSSGPSQLDQGYQDYFNYLDQLANGLPAQRASQEGTVNENFNLSKSSLDTQKAQQLSDLQAKQEKNLTQLSDYLRSAFVQGNNTLGARGASDSSAANQYAFALSKVGSQQRGDLMSGFQQATNQINTTYQTELNRLNIDKNNRLSTIAQWFNDAQNSIGGMRADAQKQKSEQALAYAMQAAQNVANAYNTSRANLESWVSYNSKSIQEAIAGMNAVNRAAPVFTGFDTAMNGYNNTTPTLFGYGNTTDQQKNPLLA